MFLSHHGIQALSLEDKPDDGRWNLVGPMNRLCRRGDSSKAWALILFVNSAASTSFVIPNPI